MWDGLATGGFMAFLSRKVDYGLLIMSVLHRRGTGASAREIAEAYDLSRPFVANILKRLCAMGLVQSHRGVRGGYVLGRPADQINMSQLMDALEDPFHLTECTTENSAPCSLSLICPVKRAIGKVHRKIGDILGHTTLQELFEETPGDEGAIQIGFVPHAQSSQGASGQSPVQVAAKNVPLNQEAMAIA